MHSRWPSCWCVSVEWEGVEMKQILLSIGDYLAAIALVMVLALVVLP